MKSIFMAILLAAGVALAHHVPVEPPLPDRQGLQRPYIDYWSPQPLDQSMYPALHPDSTYAYVGKDSIKPYYIVLYWEGDKLEAARVLGWGGWQRKLPEKDPHFRKRVRANVMYSKNLGPNLNRTIWAYLFPVRGGGNHLQPGDCNDPRNKERMLTLVEWDTGEGQGTKNGEYYLGKDYYPYYPDPGWMEVEPRIEGVIRTYDEEWPWDWTEHKPELGDNEHSCGWPLPPWFRLDEEEYDIPPIDLPAGGVGGHSGGQTPSERARVDSLRRVPYAGGR